MQSLTRLALPALLGCLCLRGPARGDEIASIINATDLFKLKTVEAPALSPDGRWIVYPLKSIVEKDGAYTYQTRLWIVESDGHSAARELTHGTSDGSPRWSPDGSQIAFIRPAGGTPQIFLLPMKGPGEAIQLTDLKTGADEPQWSPDGTRIAFISNLSWDDVRTLDKIETPSWSLQRPNRPANDTPIPPEASEKEAKGPVEAVTLADGSVASLRRWLASDESVSNPKVTLRLNFEGESGLDPTFSFAHVYITEAKSGGKAEPLTPGYANFDAPAWLPDGQHLICQGPSSMTLNPDEDLSASLYLIGLAHDTVTPLGVPGYALAQPRVSPDGTEVAFLAQPQDDLLYGQNQIGVESLDGKTPGRILTAKLDRSIGDLEWSADGKYLYFTAESNGGEPLFRVANDKAATVERLNGFDGTVAGFSVGKEHIAMARGKVTNPSELCIAGLDGKEVHVLTTHNSSWIDNKLLSNPDHRVIERPDHVKVDAWIMKPANFDQVQKYPLLLEIHGGPAAMWGPAEPTMWFEFQYFAARGYGIVYSNPRGSTGYGRTFQAGTYKDWGPGPSGDILAADDLALKESWIDPSRQVVTGGSYGGYMTAWLVTHDHRFKAAVSQRGVYDLRTFFGEGNAWQLIPFGFGGYPWDPAVGRLLELNSPITTVDQCTTPLLIQQGDNDFRVGYSGSEMLFRSLKILKQPVEYVRYPGATHELSRSGAPWQRLDTLVRYDEFFRRYVGDQ